MKRLFIVLVLLVAGIIGLGFYAGYFHVGSDQIDGKTHIELTVDQKKIQHDEKKVVEDVHDFGHPVKK